MHHFVMTTTPVITLTANLHRQREFTMLICMV